MRLLEPRHDDPVSESTEGVFLEHARVGDEIVDDFLGRVGVSPSDGVGAGEVSRMVLDGVDGILPRRPLQRVKWSAQLQFKLLFPRGLTIERSPVRTWMPITKFSGSAKNEVYCEMNASAAGFGRKR